MIRTQATENAESSQANTVKAPMAGVTVAADKKRKSGVPTGNAGEYFAMGELLRRGYDAQLADRNTKGYDLLVGFPDDDRLQKVQVKTVRKQPWYIRQSSFRGNFLDQTTIYVLIGDEAAKAPVRYFIARNRDIASEVSVPPAWRENDTAFMMLKSVLAYEDQWDVFSKKENC